MPLIESSNYLPPFYLKNGHLATVLPSMFRKIAGVNYQRERMDLSDGDFLDLDWTKSNSKRLVIVSHGLEGSSDRPYVKGMVRHFMDMGWDALAWNCRSCSGEINLKPRFYHHGATEDLREVVDYVTGLGCYDTIWLMGFSMGGSLSLKYLGEEGHSLYQEVKGGVVFSVPCDLKSSVDELNKARNGFYRKRFLKKLQKKIEAKSKLFPEMINSEDFGRIRYFQDFDNRYTAPLHGFEDADDFYKKASAMQYLSNIKVPTLIVNAWNDPFLPPACYPEKLAADHPWVHLETPFYGGHVGFSLSGGAESWMEQRAEAFVRTIERY